MGFCTLGEMVGLLQVLGSHSTSANKDWRAQGRGEFNTISWNPICIHDVFDAVELQDVNSGTRTLRAESESTKQTYKMLYRHQQSQELKWVV
jgi:hypothetical protein